MKRNRFIGKVEILFPSIISVLGFILAFILNLRIDLLQDYDKLFSNTISFSSIFIGMLITLVGLILGFASKCVIKRIKSRNADKLLISYFKRPIFIGIFLVVICLCLSNLFDERIIEAELGLKFISAFWVLLVLYFLFSAIRVILLTFMILREVFYEDTEDMKIENSSNQRKDDKTIKFDEDCF